VDATNQGALTASTGLVRYNSLRTVPGKVSLAARSPWRGKRGLRAEGRESRVEGQRSKGGPRISGEVQLGICAVVVRVGP
jgi:hypothetical protein